MPESKTLWIQLEYAVGEGNADKLAQVCEQHRDSILTYFGDWRKAPEAIRDNPQALERYAHTLITVAAHFADKLGNPTLMQMLMPDQDNPFQQWREMVEAIDEVKARGNYEEALEGMAAVMELTSKIQGPGAASLFAHTYGRYGELYYRVGDFEHSRVYNELALKACFEAGDTEGVLIYIKNLYEVASVSEDHREMEKWSAIGIQTSIDLGQHAEASEWWFKMAESQDAQGRWPEAAQTLGRALDSARASPPNNESAFSIYLNNAAMLLRSHKELEKARPLYEEAIALRRSAGLHDVTLAQFLQNLAALHLQRDDVKPAGALLEEALAIERSLLPADALLIAQTLNNLGVYYQTLGDVDKARGFYDESLRLRTMRTGRDDAEHGALLHNWAKLELEIGNDPAAKALYDRLEEVLPAGEEDDTERPYRLSHVASLYDRLGRYDLAEDLMRQVVDSIERLQGKDAPDYARSLANLAAIKERQGRLKEAEGLFRDSIRHMLAGNGFEEDDLSSSLHSLGFFYYYRGKTAEAEKLLAKAIEQRRRTLASDDPKLLHSLTSLGLVYIEQKRYDEAEQILREVLETRRKALIPDHPGIAHSLFNLGMLYSEMGRIAEALPLLKEHFEAKDRLLANVFSVASESERLAYAAKLRHQLDVLLVQMIKLNWVDRGDAVRIAFEAVLRCKGIVVEAGAKDRSAVLAGQNPLTRELLEELNTVRSRLARGILDGPTGDAVAHEVHLSRLAREREQLESKLARALSEAGITSQSRIDCRVAAEALPPDSALLEFVKFQITTTGATPDQTSEAYVMFVLPNGEPDNLTLYLLGTAEYLEPAVESFRAAITQDDEIFHRLGNIGIDTTDVAATEIDVGAFLTELLINRIRPTLGSRKRLFIGPDGIFNRLPFDTLPSQSGECLGEEFEISYLSSGRDLLRIHSATDHQTGPAVVVADPDFNLEPAAGSAVCDSSAELRSLRSMSLRFQPLPDTRKEGEWVASRLGAEPWFGAQALEAKIKSCQSPRILHLATHGFFLSQNLQRNVNPDSARVETVVATSVSQSVDNPLLRSGLALAGANRWLDGHSLPVEAEDGLLTAEDVCSINLLGTELVVLSACETGLGEYHSGEGVFGLRRAFELAGARSLIMSLWRVPSDPTRELMEEFYRQLSLGKRRSQALREAQRILRRRYPETFCWGAFVLSGDPAPLQL
jgi:CHAT domain-containing protein/tetratricopeptide (TPR) repeat protein